MNILQLVTRRQFRGAEVFAAELSSKLALRGHEITYVGLYSAPEHQLCAQNCVNIDLDAGKSFINPSLVLKLVKLIKRIDPDIIQANGSDTLKYAVLASYFVPSVKIFYRNISMVSAWSQPGSLKMKFNRFLFRKVDFVTSVGQESLNDLVATYNYPVGKTKLIRRGIPHVKVDKAEARKQLANMFGFSPEDKVLIHAGRFSPEKNHTFLLKAFEKISGRQKDLRLIFIGEGPGEQDIKVEAAKTGNVFFAGHKENIQQLLAGCDLFVLGSTIEGVPGVILEAAMQSVPAVAVNVGGVAEVVIDNVTGRLIATHDVNAFAEAVACLLENDALREQMGANALKMVLENYTLEKCAANFEEVYASVL